MCEIQKKRRLQGFTLIEMMIVIAIIGILAAIAFPVYSDYTARAQVTEGLTATSGLQADIGVDTAEAGGSTPSASAATVSSALLIEGKYIGAAGKVTVTAATGVINVGFTNGMPAGQTMIITPNMNAALTQISSWTCSGITPTAWIPSGCR